MIVATPERRSRLNEWLARSGVDLTGAWADGSYVGLDAAETMSRFIVNGRPDAAAFWATISPVLTAAASRNGPVRVFGEMVAALWDTGQVNAAIEVEALWNEISSQYSFALLCAYPTAALTDDEHGDSLAQVCCAHTAVVGAPVGAGEAWLPG